MLGFSLTRAKVVKLNLTPKEKKRRLSHSRFATWRQSGLSGLREQLEHDATTAYGKPTHTLVIFLWKRSCNAISGLSLIHI